MGIEATTSSATTPVPTQTGNSSSSKTGSSDTSFKKEMSKVSESENKDSKTTEKETKDVKNDKKVDSKDEKLSSSQNDDICKISSKNDDANNIQSALFSGQIAMNDANIMLSNDIAQMIENTVSTNAANLKNWSFGFENDFSKSSLKINESDANFFIDLAQNENINVQSIQAQAQGMLNAGADIAEVKQNVQVSQALLEALSKARENNQPLRIDFDQNISVILRVGRDGAVSAQFIPGDKAVEQYLRHNIESLKSSFEEQELPYSELSYSTASKEQNQRRRQEKQQGE